MTPEAGCALVRGMFAAFTDRAVPPDAVCDRLAPDYVQWVDGHVLDLAGFRAHLEEVRARTLSVQVSFEHLASDGRSAASIHVAEVVKADGARARVRVIAVYAFSGGRISRVDELTHLLSGAEGDRALGSALPQ